MKISLQWLNEWVDLSQFQTPEAVGELLTRRGLEVESIHHQAKGLEKVISVQIVEKEKHPEADRLSVCKVNTGSGEYLDIVCGAQNMKRGDIVCLAQIGALLPNGLKIEKSKIRGVVSNGMLCSETELGFKDTSDGILILPEKTPLGWKISDIFGIEDTIFEIKLTANRGDCLSHRGLAREIAAAIGKPLKHPKVSTLDFKNSPIALELNAGEAAPQFFGCWMEGVSVSPSPTWLKRRLEAIGQRSINNLVDASNFLMFEYGFPVHIYDADKIEGNCLKVRHSEKGEKLPLLDGTEIETTGEELLIVDGKKPVGLAGVMGGGNSEVSETTKRVFLECAEFNPTLVRRAAFRFSRRSEASLRFEKGIDPSGLKEALCRLADLVAKVSQGEVVGSVQALLPSREHFQSTAILVSTNYVNSFLGTALSDAEMISIFESLECKVQGVNLKEQKQSGTVLSVTPPSYRLDLNIPQDLAEEVARTIGYEAIPSTIPVLTGMPKTKQANMAAHRLSVIDSMKNILAREGLHEVLTYAFQSEGWMQKFGFQSSVKILNPLSEEQGFMVPSLLPGLMKAYQENERHHFGSEPLSVRLFEVRPTFEFKGLKEGLHEIAAKNEMETGVTETWKVSFLISGPRFDQALKSERGEVDFYDLKSLVEILFESLATKGIRLRAVDENILSIQANLFHPGQTAQVAVGKEAIGVMGRIHPKLEAELKLRQPVFWGELLIDPVITLTSAKERAFKAWSGLPTMERDYALLVEEQVSAENLIQSAIKHGKPIAKVVKIFDTYKGAHVPTGKVSIGVRVIFSDEDKSLEEKQVDQCSALIVKKWTEEFGAVLR